MNFNIPKPEMVRTFLELKGWESKEKNNNYQQFTPPKEVKVDKPLFLNVPNHEMSPDYREYILQLVFSIAEIYEIDKWKLVSDLSQNVKELQKQIEDLQKEINLKNKMLQKLTYQRKPLSSNLEILATT